MRQDGACLTLRRFSRTVVFMRRFVRVDGWRAGPTFGRLIEQGRLPDRIGQKIYLPLRRFDVRFRSKRIGERATLRLSSMFASGIMETHRRGFGRLFGLVTLR